MTESAPVVENVRPVEQPSSAPGPESAPSVVVEQPQPVSVLPATEEKEKEKEVVSAQQPPKKKTTKRKVPFCGMYPQADYRVTKKANTGPKRIGKIDINNMLEARSSSVGSVVSKLFTFEDYVVINNAGDVRFGECILLTRLGPFSDNEAVKIIDWLPSVSTMLVSKTAKISDTVAFEIAPASVSSVVPLQILPH